MKIIAQYYAKICISKPIEIMGFDTHGQTLSTASDAEAKRNALKPAYWVEGIMREKLVVPGWRWSENIMVCFTTHVRSCCFCQTSREGDMGEDK